MVHSAFLKIPDSVHLFSPECPQEWIHNTHRQRFHALKFLYIFCQGLYANGSFEQVLGLLHHHWAFIGSQFKCLLELNKPNKILWECGEALKHYDTDLDS
jgi:hypothetical protein